MYVGFYADRYRRVSGATADSPYNGNTYQISDASLTSRFLACGSDFNVVVFARRAKKRPEKGVPLIAHVSHAMG